MNGKLLAAYVFVSLVACATVAAAEGRTWWRPRWRLRTEVVRPIPYRTAAARPAEAPVDFALLMKRGGVAGEFDPASVRVVHGEVEIPSVFRTEFDPKAGRTRSYVAWLARPGHGHGRKFDIYFDTKDRGVKVPTYDATALPPENLVKNPGFESLTNGAPDAWEVSPSALARTGKFNHTTGERSLSIVVDENTPKDVSRNVGLSQTIDVAAFAGEEMVFECDLMAERAEYGAPVSIQLQQFRKDGSRIPEFAVQSRWLTLELAQSHLVQFRQRGRFNPDAATLKVVILMRCSVTEEDTRARVTGPESFFTIWLDRVVVRPGERWPWPAATHAGFVDGALTNAPLNRAVDFTGKRRLAFNGGSEGALQAARYDEPDAAHWGLQAGTLEFWCKPKWNSDDGRDHVFFDGTAYMHRLQSRLDKRGSSGKNALRCIIADSNEKRHTVQGPVQLCAGQWHHIAATWDLPKAHMQLFVDGKLVASDGPGKEPWPWSLAFKGDKALKGMGITDEDKRSLPMQAFIGGCKSCRDNTSAQAAIDEFRVSDVVRYSGPFTPPREEFEVDDHTRVLFHLDGEHHGVHGGDDRFVRGHLACELPRQAENALLEALANGKVERRVAQVRAEPPVELLEKNRADNRLMSRRPARDLPDPRFVEYRERQIERVVRSTNEELSLDVAGDYEPLMRCVTFVHADPAAADATLLPRWRANDSVVPFSVQTLRSTFAANAKNDAERARQVFGYSLLTTNYYDAHYCETLSKLHRTRVSYTLIKALNIYPFDQCGPLNFTLRKMFLAGGVSSNDASGTHHQFEQAFYDGGWRLFDLSSRLYWLKRDNTTVAGRDELEDDLHLKIRQDGGVCAWIRGRRSQGRFGGAVKPHSMDFSLRPGEGASICWHNEGRWFEITGKREPIPLAKIPPYFGNGTITYEPIRRGDAAVFENMRVDASGNATVLSADDPGKPAALIYRAQCPYIFSDSRVRGQYRANAAGAIRLSLSFDGGKQLTEVWRNVDKAGRMDVSLLDRVTARYAYWVKIQFAAGQGAVVSGLKVRSTFIASPMSLPGRLRRGHNRIRFVAGPVTAPVKTACRWVERHKSDLGVALNAISYYMNGDDAHRNLFVSAPGQEAAVTVTLLGQREAGSVSLAGLPARWVVGPRELPVAPPGEAHPGQVQFKLRPDAAAGEIRGFDAVVRQGERERRVPAQVLVAHSPLCREAESADEMSGNVQPRDLPEASGAAIVAFTGKGTLEYDLDAANGGKHALWLRGRWEPGSSTSMTLTVDSNARHLRAVAMIGFSDWTDPHKAHTKMFAHFGEQYGHWSWYRIPDVQLTPGKHRLTVAAGAGAAFDALVLLPQNPVMDRAGMNLFQNWNYAPWHNPM